MAAVLPRDVLVVAGSDSVSFLHGQVSADLAALEVGGRTLALLLQPTGKLDAVLRLWRIDDDVVVLDADAGAADAVEARLRRFLLRADVSIERVDPAEAPRGVDQTLPPFEPPESLDWEDPAAVEVARLRAGWPSHGAEIAGPFSGEVIPAEVGEWLIDAAVSFTKGCYVGQELTARINARGGNVPRRLRSFEVPSGMTASPGDSIVVLGEESSGPEGTVTSAAVDPLSGATVAMGYVHRRVGATAQLTIA